MRTAVQMTDKKDQKRPASGVLAASSTKRSPTPDNEAFEKEVDEELQREWLSQLWEQYSAYIVGAAVALVLGVGIYKFVESRRQAAAEAAGAQYVAAVKLLAEGKADAGAEALAAVAKNSSGLGAVARLRLAAADATAGKTDVALAKYEAIAAERGLDPILTDFARLQTAMLTLDTAPLADIQAKLGSLASENNPWRYNAMELLGLAALKAGKTDEARAQFEKLIGDQAVPQGIAERARIVMGSLVAADLAKTAAPAQPAPAQPVQPQAPQAAPAQQAPAPASPPAKKK